MWRQNRIHALSKLLLRLGFVLALFVMLNLPHPGTTAVTETPAMTMYHTADTQGKMSHAGGVHEWIKAALCAVLCASLEAAEGPMHLARIVVFAFARWPIDADPVWVPFRPDPAQRPPI